MIEKTTSCSVLNDIQKSGKYALVAHGSKFKGVRVKVKKAKNQIKCQKMVEVVKFFK